MSLVIPDNQRKNAALAAIAAAAPGLLRAVTNTDGTVDQVFRSAPTWAYDANRVLHITLPVAGVPEKAAARAALAQQFGTTVVIE